MLVFETVRCSSGIELSSNKQVVLRALKVQLVCEVLCSMYVRASPGSVCACLTPVYILRVLTIMLFLQSHQFSSGGVFRSMSDNSPMSRLRSQPSNLEGQSRAETLTEARNWLLFHACEQPPPTLRPVWETRGMIGEAFASPALVPLGLAWPPLPPVPPREAVPFTRAAGISSQQAIPSSLGGVPGAGRIPSKRSGGTPAEVAEDREPRRSPGHVARLATSSEFSSAEVTHDRVCRLSLREQEHWYSKRQEYIG